MAPPVVLKMIFFINIETYEQEVNVSKSPIGTRIWWRRIMAYYLYKYIMLSKNTHNTTDYTRSDILRLQARTHIDFAIFDQIYRSNQTKKWSSVR